MVGAAFLFLSKIRTLGPLFAERRVIQQLYSELFELHQDVLCPGQTLEIFERFEIFGSDALFDCIVHGSDLLAIIFQKLILEGF